MYMWRRSSEIVDVWEQNCLFIFPLGDRRHATPFEEFDLSSFAGKTQFFRTRRTRYNELRQSLTYII